jgi:hypothetical protein
MMRILQVSAEIFPLLKTGGLADIAGALPQALAGERKISRVAQMRPFKNATSAGKALPRQGQALGPCAGGQLLAQRRRQRYTIAQALGLALQTPVTGHAHRLARGTGRQAGQCSHGTSDLLLVMRHIAEAADVDGQQPGVLPVLAPARLVAEEIGNDGVTETVAAAPRTGLISRYSVLVPITGSPAG